VRNTLPPKTITATDADVIESQLNRVTGTLAVLQTVPISLGIAGPGPSDSANTGAVMSDRIGYARCSIHSMINPMAPGHTSNIRLEDMMSRRIQELLKRYAAIRNAIEAELRIQRPSLLRLMRLKRLQLLITGRIGAAVQAAALRRAASPRFIPKIARERARYLAPLMTQAGHASSYRA
jgi:hypothetical protein